MPGFGSFRFFSKVAFARGRLLGGGEMVVGFGGIGRDDVGSVLAVVG